jgi:hypothetical protein
MAKGWLLAWLVPAARLVAFLRINKQYLHMKGLRARAGAANSEIL